MYHLPRLSSSFSRLAVTALVTGVLAFPTAACAETLMDMGGRRKAMDVETYEYLNLFGDVFERVREHYVDEVPDKELMEDAINGMLQALDPHSSFLNNDSFEDMRIQTRGEFGGLGIEVTMENGLVKVVSPIDETPAAEAGLESGDMIIRIDGEEVMGLTLSEAVDRMRGRVGSDIVITVVRPDEPEPFDVEITRDIIKIRPVRHEILGDDVGYIRLTTFNEQVEDALPDAIEEIQDEIGEDNISGYILDLRNNPGGLLDQAIFVSDAFLDKGEIVSRRGRTPESTRRSNARRGDLTNNKPIVVLINSGSASASEIVAGALQDHRRAVLLGTKSFGKGSVQTVMALPGYGAIRLTTERYYTPSGRSIQAEGIEPDIIVKQANIEEIDSKFERPREADLQKALDADKRRRGEDIEDEDNDDDKWQKDYQLTRAVDLVRGVARFGEASIMMHKEKIESEESASETGSESDGN